MDGWWLLPGILAGIGIFARRRKEKPMAKKKKNKSTRVRIRAADAKGSWGKHSPRHLPCKNLYPVRTLLVAFHAFTWLFALKGYIKWGYGTAQIVSSILNTMGIQNTVDYNIIHLRNDTWNVTSECTAVNAVFLFISFILAYSSTVKSKTLGLISGIPLIIVVNIFRLVVLGWVTEYWPTQAHLFHDYVWETIFLFFIILLWFMWINLVVNREKTAAVSR